MEKMFTPGLFKNVHSSPLFANPWSTWDLDPSAWLCHYQTLTLSVWGRWTESWLPLGGQKAECSSMKEERPWQQRMKRGIRNATDKPSPFPSFASVQPICLWRNFRWQMPWHLITGLIIMVTTTIYGLNTNVPGNDLDALYFIYSTELWHRWYFSLIRKLKFRQVTWFHPS